MPKRKKIVTLGGGTGQCALLAGLRELTGIDVTAVVSMADSGGSTGRLRDEMGVLPPGDILKCLLALSPYQKVATQILQKRFTINERLQGHNSGNLLLTVLSQYAGSFPEGIKALGEALDVRGNVLPVTINKATLVAELSNGERVYGEANIDEPGRKKRATIRGAFLVPHYGESIQAYPPVIEAIDRAEYLILGPGDLFTSIIPNLLVGDVKEAIGRSRAKLIYVVNIMTKNGETDEFLGSDFVEKMEDFLEKKLEYVIFNTKTPPSNLLENYRIEKSEPVQFDKNYPWEKRKVILKNLLDTLGEEIRHHSKKLGKVIEEILGKR